MCPIPSLPVQDIKEKTVAGGRTDGKTVRTDGRTTRKQFTPRKHSLRSGV